MRVGMIHQPHFLPWSGYVARCLAADVVLFNEQARFNGHDYQHRTRFLDRDGRARWLTLPIRRSTRDGPIDQVELAESFGRKRWQRALIEAYRGDEAFEDAWRLISQCIDDSAPNLAAINRSSLVRICGLLTPNGSLPEFARSDPLGAEQERTARLIQLARESDATHVIMGRDSLACHNLELMTSSGIELLTHHFSGPSTEAPQAGVSVLHDISQHGVLETYERIQRNWRLSPISAGAG